MNILIEEPTKLGTVIVGRYDTIFAVFVHDGHVCHPWYNIDLGNLAWHQIKNPVLLKAGWTHYDQVYDDYKKVDDK